MILIRADVLLVQRGLIATRAKAREAIAAGHVHANGRIIKKPSEALAHDCDLQAMPAHQWVSRAGLKLEAALSHFGLRVTGRHCLDIGASTGGFTQVLRAYGAAHVLAVDVGRGQLDAVVGNDQGVTSLEGQDARTLSAEQLRKPPPDLVVIDVSFIGIEKILPHILTLLPDQLDLVALVKPQFQAGPQRVGKKGIVDPQMAATIAEEVRQMLGQMEGLEVIDMIDSPILGGDGNHEFLLWAQRSIEPQI